MAFWRDWLSLGVRAEREDVITLSVKGSRRGTISSQLMVRPLD